MSITIVEPRRGEPEPFPCPNCGGRYCDGDCRIIKPGMGATMPTPFPKPEFAMARPEDIIPGLCGKCISWVAGVREPGNEPLAYFGNCSGWAEGPMRSPIDGYCYKFTPRPAPDPPAPREPIAYSVTIDGWVGRVWRDLGVWIYKDRRIYKDCQTFFDTPFAAACHLLGNRLAELAIDQSTIATWIDSVATQLWRLYTTREMSDWTPECAAESEEVQSEQS